VRSWSSDAPIDVAELRAWADWVRRQPVAPSRLVSWLFWQAARLEHTAWDMEAAQSPPDVELTIAEGDEVPLVQAGHGFRLTADGPERSIERSIYNPAMRVLRLWLAPLAGPGEPR
jgi:hypothetical protein